MSKDKRNTKKGLAYARRKAAEEAKAARPQQHWVKRHVLAEMDKMLKDIDPDRFEELADGGK